MLAKLKQNSARPKLVVKTNATDIGEFTITVLTCFIMNLINALGEELCPPPLFRVEFIVDIYFICLHKKVSDECSEAKIFCAIHLVVTMHINLVKIIMILFRTTI